MNYDTCPTESNYCPMKAMSQNTERIKNRFEFQTASRLYEQNVIFTSSSKKKQDIESFTMISYSQGELGKKSSNLYFLKFDRGTEKVSFQNNILNQMK